MRNNTFERAKEIWNTKEAEYEQLLIDAQTTQHMEEADTFLYRARHQWQLAVKRAFRHGTQTMSPDQFEAHWKEEHGPASYAKQEERIALRAERMAQLHEKRRSLEIADKLYEKLGKLGLPD